MSKTLSVPRLSLVLLIGPAGAGKTTFAAKHFLPTEILSSDHMRATIDDDENSQGATGDAFEVLRLIASKRLARGRLTVIDATNVNAEDRRPLIRLAQKHHAAPVAILLNVDKDICVQRNAQRADHPDLTPALVDRHVAAMEKTLSAVRREGFYRVHVLSTPAEIENVAIHRERMRADMCDETGPFDIVGDVHGCADELEQLLTRLGYAPDDGGVWRHGDNRRVVFVGDVVNRGPRSLDALRLAMSMTKAGSAFFVPGNHENNLLSWIGGKTFAPAHGLRETLDEIDSLPPDQWAELKRELAIFLKSQSSHFILDGGRLIVTHAGMKTEMAGRVGVRRFAMYGETRGEIDGYARRKAPMWATRHRSDVKIIYGHAAVVEPKQVNNTLNIDTGCVFGGRLTALRYPEGELVSVEAAKAYCEPDPKPPAEKGETKGSDEAPAESKAVGAEQDTPEEAPGDAGEASSDA